MIPRDIDIQVFETDMLIHYLKVYDGFVVLKTVVKANSHKSFKVFVAPNHKDV